MRYFAILLLAIASGGCSNVGYYLQSVSGQLDIWRRERPIDEIVSDPAAPAPLRDKLAKVLEMRRFASAELGLPDDGSYTRYADLERQFVVWNVFATPEFSMRPLQWCFPIAGCVSYRGYFSREDAERFAATVAAEGNDVFVGGVPAYSTLGWFADPVLNTFIHYPEHRIARLIFHELSHRVVYAPGDTVFNESFAVAVEQVGVARWLERHGTERARQAFEREQAYRQDFIDLVQRYHRQLTGLYDGGLDRAAMRKRKNEAIDEMLRDYGRLKEQWGGFEGYDAWFARRPNNAQIASVAIYTRLVPAFRALLRQEQNDLPRFYAAARKLAAMPKEARTAALERLQQAALEARAPIM
ncbi:MAG: aminopeptidase [Betaproteobacteria bacterium]